jgi:hypothetical protein
METDSFVDTFKHFIKYSYSSKDNTFPITDNMMSLYNAKMYNNQ